MADVELRSKTELTSIAGTENIYVQEAGSPYTVKRTLLNTIRSWIMTAPSNTVLKTSSYAILDNDGYTRIEVDTSSAAVTITLPLMSNNRGRRIEIAFIKNDVSADVVTISPHATDANKLSSAGLASIVLYKVGDLIIFQESVNSGYWEIIERLETSTGKAPKYSCRAWVNFDGTGTPAIRSAGNVGSIGDVGTGTYTLNFIENMPDTNYIIIGTALATVGGRTCTVSPLVSGTYSTSAVQILVKDSSDTAIDSTLISVAIFR